MVDKEMTPCEKLGYKVGDKFIYISDDEDFEQGSVIVLKEDDGSECVQFYVEPDRNDYAYANLSDVRPVSQSRPIVSGFDNVDKPAHYASGDIECIDAIRAQMTPEEFQGYLKGNVAKYMWRWRDKGGAESLRKARWYLDRLISTEI